MKFISEFKQFFEIGDVVLIEYWYNHMVTPVEIIDIIGKKYLVSHKVEKSNIQNAPNEKIKKSDIISKFRS